tara:strand:+ start:38 stop:613 length:576 start_codon:yes stop_codon:yes gene_type:complete
MNNTSAHQVLNDFNLMNKIVKQKQTICCEIGKKIFNDYSGYENSISRLVVKCIEEYFKTEVTPKIRALNWKNICRVLIYVKSDYDEVGCRVWHNYDEDDSWSDTGFWSYKDYKTMLDETISQMKEHIDNGDFYLPNYSNHMCGFNKDDPETQIKLYRKFKNFDFNLDAEITIIKKARPLKGVSRKFSFDRN